jgi:hypothetical protein
MSTGAPLPDPVDLDRLADYAAGVLDPADAAEVEHRIGTDERWARALDALAVADEAIRAELRDLSSSPAPMPADVATRIEDALREAARDSSVISLADARAKRRGGRRRFVTGITAAAATLVLVLCGVTFVRGGMIQMDSEAPSAGGAPNAVNDGQGAAEAPGQAFATDRASATRAAIVITTGTNYSQQALLDLTEKPPAWSVPPSLAVGEKSGQDAPPEPAVPSPVAQQAPTALNRLTQRPALAACLKAILDKYPGVPTLIDYARYEGRPALIVSVLGDASTTVVAVGGGCGVIGPDEIASATRP